MTPSRPVLRYFGGKWLLAPWIISHFPPHKVYVEPFGGGASVLMRKRPADLEIYNDLNSELVNVFRVLRDNESASNLARMLKYTPHSRDEYNLAHIATDNPVEQARRTIVRASVGYGSNGVNRVKTKTGFRQRVDLVFSDYADSISSFTDRLSRVVIENKDYRDLIDNLDSPETLFYFDPPYVHSTRGDVYKDRYIHELTDQDQEILVDKIKSIRGMVILSGYPNSIYESLGWETRSIKTSCDSGKSKDSERTEVLWLNPASEKAQSQQSLF